MHRRHWDSLSPCLGRRGVLSGCYPGAIWVQCEKMMMMTMMFMMMMLIVDDDDDDHDGDDVDVDDDVVVGDDNDVGSPLSNKSPSD